MPIRIATSADIDRLERYEHISRERLARCVADGFVYAILVGGEIRGILRYSLFWQSLPLLDLIFIEAAARGKGIGTACMRFWEAEMKSAGFEDVLVSTQADETAMLFYEKIGYKRIGSFLPPGQEADELMYSKRI